MYLYHCQKNQVLISIKLVKSMKVIYLKGSSIDIIIQFLYYYHYYESLSSCVILEGSGTIVIKVKVVRDDGSLLSVGIALYSVNYYFYLYYHLQILALNACTLALIDSGFPMYTLPVSISICGVLLPSSSISYYVDPSKDDEKSDKKFFNVFTFLVFSELSLSSQSTSTSRHNYEILKGTSTLIASGTFIFHYCFIIMILLIITRIYGGINI